MNVIIHNECHNEFKLFRTSSEILDRCLIDFHNFLDRCLNDFHILSRWKIASRIENIWKRSV